MSDVLYTLSVCGPLIVLVKRDLHIVAFNKSAQEPSPLTPLDEIGYAKIDGINQVASIKTFPDSKYAPKKRNAEKRNLQIVQDAQLALELERYLHDLERSFAIEELSPTWYPIRMLADVLRFQSEYELPEIGLAQLSIDLVTHADMLVRQNLEQSELILPKFQPLSSDSSPNPSVTATRITLSYFEKILNDYSLAQTKTVKSKVKQLLAS